MSALTPQLENSWSRAGVLFGLLNATIKSGYLVMVKDTDAIEFEWRVNVGRDWLAFSHFVALETLGQVGVSLNAIAAEVIAHWNERLKQLREQKPN